MTINIPSSRKEIADRIKTDVQLALPNSQPFLPVSFLGAMLTGTSGRVYEFYLQLQEMLKQMFPDTATGVYLERWGSYVKLPKNAASKSSGKIVITGSEGILVEAGTVFNSADANQFSVQNSTSSVLNTQNISSLTRSGSIVTATTDSDHYLATGMNIIIIGAVETEYNGTFVINVTSQTEFTYTINTTPSTPATGAPTASYIGALVDLESVGYGASTNEPSGVKLIPLNPISGLSNFGLVTFDGLSGGTDIEEDEAYRARVLFRYQNPHALFNAAEIETQARKVSGVTRVWVKTITPVVGKVTIYFTRDNDDNILPTPAEAAEVKAKILEIMPAHMEDTQVIVASPTGVNVTFTFSALNPDTPEMRKAITDNLKFFFKDGTQVGENLTSVSYLSVIYNTIDSTGSQVKSFALSSPSGDVTINSGELAIMNSNPTFP